MTHPAAREALSSQGRNGVAKRGAHVNNVPLTDPKESRDTAAHIHAKEGEFIMVAHGGDTGTFSNELKIVMSTDQVVDQMKTNGFDPTVHTTVKIYSCYAGVAGGIAEQLSRFSELSGVSFSGYSDLVTPSWTTDNPSEGFYIPSSDANVRSAKWNVYQAGTLVKSTSYYEF